MTKIDYLFKQFETILGWYKQSEEKAKFLVGLNTLVVGVANGLVFVGADKMPTARDGYTVTVWALLGLTGVALAASNILILRAMWPRHHAHDLTSRPAEKLWFFGDVASLSQEAHRDAVANWTENDLEATMVTQNYLLSRNVWIKHEALNWATTLTIVSLVLQLGLGLAYGIAVTNSR